MSDANSPQQLPWLSLSLFLATHLTFGWLVAASTTAPHWQWLGAGMAVVSIVALISPIALVEFCFGGWLQSDRNASVTVISFALALVLALRWSDWFLRAVFLVAAGVLASLDLRTAGFDRWRTLTVETIVGLGGYWAGLQLQSSPIIHGVLSHFGVA